MTKEWVSYKLFFIVIVWPILPSSKFKEKLLMNLIEVHIQLILKKEFS